ncbi:MAG TPA: PDZ domain-containing protein [Pirellulales bacterium]|nr:PDZ domain-containing protein [Pirellulales bacterium]
MSRNLHRMIARVAMMLGGPFMFASLAAADSEPKNPPTVQPPQESRDDEVVDKLRQLGAKVVRGKSLNGESHGVITVTLGGNWHGAADDLKLLKRVSDLEIVSVHGVAITDDDLMQLDGLSRLSVVALFGTKVTAEGAARFAKMNPSVTVDRRGNAMLGISALPDPAGCRITIVLSGSAADLADLRTDDIITRFQDHEIPDFATLTSLIGTCQPNDKVTIELRRREEVLKKEIKLGSWK